MVVLFVVNSRQHVIIWSMEKRKHTVCFCSNSRSALKHGFGGLSYGSRFKFKEGVTNKDFCVDKMLVPVY